MKQSIIGTGLSGLVGSRIVELLTPEYNFENLSLETGVNILNIKDLEERFSASKADWVFHLAAKTDVDGSELDKEQGINGDAWKINVGGTQNIVSACQKYHKKLLYVSTDFVFDGLEDRYYLEEDQPHPLSWYAVTKYEGEKLVLDSKIPYLICRIAFPYRAVNVNKKDLVHLIIDKLQKKESITVVSDQYITPTFIDDIALAIKLLLLKNQTGIYHLVGSEKITPLNMALKIAKTFKLNQNLISNTTLVKYYQNRAPRPFHAVLKNAKIKNLGYAMKGFSEGLEVIKKQLANC